MRIFVAFLLSFALVGTVGALVLPDPRPRAKLRPPAGSVPVEPVLNFLPGVPSFVVPRSEDTSKGYKEAWRLLKAGQWRAAEGAYLQIAIRTPQDRKAMQGLVTLQRLLTNQNPKRLQEQAEAYRRAIAEGRTTEGRHTPREMELLAEASLLAVTEITTEQSLELSADSRVSIGSNLQRPASSPRTPMGLDPLRAIKERISQGARSLRLGPGKVGVLIGIPVADNNHVAPPSIAQTPSLGLQGDGKASGVAVDEAANPVTESPQGGTMSPGEDTSVGGHPSASPQSSAGVHDSSREGGSGNSGNSSAGSGGPNSGGAGASAGGAGASAGGTGGGAGGAGSTGGSGHSAGKDSAGKGDSGNGGGGKGGSGKGGGGKGGQD
jgi:hypothetical protein